MVAWAVGNGDRVRHGSAEIVDMKRSLTCARCNFHFSWSEFRLANRCCPYCNVPLGIPFSYRLLLATGYLCAGAWVMYAGYTEPAWLPLGLPFAFIAGVITQSLILRIVPPKLQPHAQGNIWLKLD